MSQGQHTCKNLSNTNPTKPLWRPNPAKPSVEACKKGFQTSFTTPIVIWRLHDNDVILVWEAFVKVECILAEYWQPPSWPEVQPWLLWWNPSRWGPADYSLSIIKFLILNIINIKKWINPEGVGQCGYGFFLLNLGTFWCFFWLCMTLYDCVWLCMAVYCCVWLCMAVYCFQHFCKPGCPPVKQARAKPGAAL